VPPVKERKCGAAVHWVSCREVAEAVFVLEPPGLDLFTEDTSPSGSRTGPSAAARLVECPSTSPNRNAAAVGAPDEKHGEAVQIFLATAEGGADVDPEAAGAAATAELGVFRSGAEGTIFPGHPAATGTTTGRAGGKPTSLSRANTWTTAPC